MSLARNRRRMKVTQEQLPDRVPMPDIVINVPEDESIDLDHEVSSIRLSADLIIPQPQNAAEAQPLLLQHDPLHLTGLRSAMTHRRRSPVTVHEWVASLPPPHLLPQSLKPKHDRGANKEESESESDKQLLNDSDDLEFDGCSETRPSSDDNQLGAFLAGPSATFRRLSAALEAMEEAERDALENSSTDDSNSEKCPFEPFDAGCDPKVIHLAEESPGCESDCVQLEENHNLGVVKPSPQVNLRFPFNSIGSPVDRREARRRLQFLLAQYHDLNISLPSDVAVQSSMESVLRSRSVDPMELLIDLGFGGSPSSTLSRIPTRFFASKSHAKGISVDDFLRKQAELSEKFDSGFSGYRGLNGPSSVRPSKLVEKIINKICSQERILKKQLSSLSSSSSISGLNYQHHHQQQQQWPTSSQASGPVRLTGVSAFRAAARSVLSPANRQFMEEQASRAGERSKDGLKRRLVLCGKAFSVDEDDLLLEEEDEEEHNEELQDTVSELCKDESGVMRRLSQHKRPFSKQDSLASITSSCSVESDWSDEELDEMVRVFGDIQERSTAADFSGALDVNTKVYLRKMLSRGRRFSDKNEAEETPEAAEGGHPGEAKLIYSRFASSLGGRSIAATSSPREASLLFSSRDDKRIPQRFSPNLN